MAQRSFGKCLWYDCLHVMCRLLAVIVFQTRVFGRQYVPKVGGALVLSNHQSQLDPVLVGLAADRRLNYLARRTLFRFAPFRWLIDSLDAIPIDRDGTGLGGLKETLKRLRNGELVLIFPEGTRTSDGEVAKLKPGFVALARRAGVPLLPVGVDGAYQAWPRGAKLPRRAEIHVVFGQPVTPSEIESWDDHALITEVESRIRTCHAAARRGREQGSF